MEIMPPRKAAMKPDELQRLLDKNDLNQSTGAERLGVNRRTVIRWLQGTTPIRPASAALIRNTLGK